MDTSKIAIKTSDGTISWVDATKAQKTEFVRGKLTSDPRWVTWGIRRLYERQTADEQDRHTTNHHNGRGFNGTDAELLTSYADWLDGRGQWARRGGRALTDKQLVWAYRKMGKYAGQIVEEIDGRVSVNPANPQSNPQPAAISIRRTCPVCNVAVEVDGFCPHCEEVRIMQAELSQRTAIPLSGARYQITTQPTHSTAAALFGSAVPAGVMVLEGDPDEYPDGGAAEADVADVWATQETVPARSFTVSLDGKAALTTADLREALNRAITSVHRGIVLVDGIGDGDRIALPNVANLWVVRRGAQLLITDGTNEVVLPFKAAKWTPGTSGTLNRR